MNDPDPHFELVRHPLRMRRVRVDRVERLTPRTVRVALGGADLDGFRCDGPADHVKLFAPPAGHDEPELPAIGPDGLVPTPGRPRPPGRDYTPRLAPLHHGRLEIDLVVHPGGHAAAWADRARVGHIVGVAGPRGSHVLRPGLGRIVLIGDETALPAIDNFLWLLADASCHTTVVAEIADAGEVRTFDRAPDEIHWVHRPGAPGDPEALTETVRRLTPHAAALHWVAAETSVAAAVRTTLVDQLGIPATAVRARGYWRRGTADHQEPHTD